MSRLGTSVFLIGGVIAVALTAGLSLFFGSTPIPPTRCWRRSSRQIWRTRSTWPSLELRGPRTVGCILVGAAFAVAGAIMQGVTRNPLADSGLLGINAGAAFALALCLALLPGMSFAGVVGCSFVGATFALAVVFGAVSFRRRNVDPVLLVLAGCAVGLFLTALAQGVAIFFNIGYSLTFWTAGGVAGIRADTLAMTAPFIAAALAAAWVLARRVTVLSLGEDAAAGLGVNVGASRALCLLVVLVLAGAAVALAGPVAFVGLMVPHMVRRFVGSDYRAVIPASVVGGALLMLLADVLARTLMAPSEIPIGIIFAIVGVPFFIWCARREASGLGRYGSRQASRSASRAAAVAGTATPPRHPCGARDARRRASRYLPSAALRPARRPNDMAIEWLAPATVTG